MLAKNAIVLLSGGLDSSTVLAIAQSEGYAIHTLAFRYGQRHVAELDAAENIARAFNVASHTVFDINIASFGGSVLTDAQAKVPDYRAREDIPSTYVPARNTIMLSVALGLAETRQAYDIFYGANIIDYSNYPDCRPEYIQAFENMANLATRAGVEGRHTRFHAPLMQLSKTEIIQKGVALGVDYGMTVSCYDADETGAACGKCDACFYRMEGFEKAGVPDPTRYQTTT